VGASFFLASASAGCGRHLAHYLSVCDRLTGMPTRVDSM
jgi:hypothetical protein